MRLDESKYPDDPRIREAASDVCRIAAWIEHHHPKLGTFLAFSYDYTGPDGGTVHLVDVFRRKAVFGIDYELSRLATRAAWALGWPLPSRDTGLSLSAPDHRLLSNHERLIAIQHIDAAMAAALPEILERPVRLGDKLRDSDMDDYDFTTVWLNYLARKRTTSMVVEHDHTGPLQRRIADITVTDGSGLDNQPTPRPSEPVRLETTDKVGDPVVAGETVKALVAPGRRDDPAIESADQAQTTGSTR